MPSRPRLDEFLVTSGFYESLQSAKRACLAGDVIVDGITMTKPGTSVSGNVLIQIKPAKRYVSRGGDKLAGALLDFDYSPQALKCIDVGASSGGFTDCLLQNGASSVTAVDVGYGQFDWRLRQNSQVQLFERTSISKASPLELGAPFELLVADLSFTSLARLASQLAALLGNLNDALVLVKPQFELPKALVKNGVVTKLGDHQKAIEIALKGFIAADLQPQDLVLSKLHGPKGNIEFFLWVRKAGLPVNIDIEKVVHDAHRKVKRS